MKTLEHWNCYWRERCSRRGGWLDDALAPGGFLELNAAYIAPLLADQDAVAVLDAACGIGGGIIALAQHGFVADGSDGSAVAIECARDLLTGRTFSSRLAHSSWADLGEAPGLLPEYDAVLCDALLWCETEGELRASARGIRSRLHAGGTLIFHGVDPTTDAARLEKLLAAAVVSARTREERLGDLVHRVEYSRQGDALQEEHYFSDGDVEHRAVLRQYFRHTWAAMRNALRAVGFAEIDSRSVDGPAGPRHYVVAVAGTADGKRSSACPLPPRR